MARMLPRYAQAGSDMINRRQYLNALKVELDLENDHMANFHLTIPFDFMDDLGCHLVPIYDLSCFFKFLWHATFEYIHGKRSTAQG